MSYVTDHFIVSEFDCRDLTPYPEHLIESCLLPLCESLEAIRAVIQKPIIIVSGYRTEKHNRAMGGSRNSQHLQGKAADIMVDGMSGFELAKIVKRLISDKKIICGGVGEYSHFCHYDIRCKNARWRGK